MELSELEDALLAAHLRKCAGCWTFAVDLEALTEKLRTAPLAEPSVRFQLPRRPARFGMARIGMARAGTAAAAAITALIAVVSVSGLHPSPSQISASELQSVRDRMTMKERMMQELETTTVRQVQDVPRGLRAARDATLRPNHGMG